MSVPPEYTNALANLKAFRGKILQDLVGERVVAGLDANHESMLKYKGLIENINIVPYVFARVRESALALKLKGLDVGAGEINKIVARYTGDLAEYPMTLPFSVPQRKLPQVDVYIYETIKDIDLLKETDINAIKSFILIQAPSDTFEETPDAENAFYDYYSYYPNSRWKGEWLVLGLIPPLSEWVSIRGEQTFCVRALTPKGETDDVWYYLRICLEGAVYSETAYMENPPVIVWHPEYTLTRPAVTINVAGQHIPSTEFGAFCNIHSKDQRFFLGFQHISTDLGIVTEEAVWYNEWTLSISVTPEGAGTTSPAVGDHIYQSPLAVGVTAYPEAGWTFDHWERNGVNKGSLNPISVTMYKDYDLKAVFVPT